MRLGKKTKMDKLLRFIRENLKNLPKSCWNLKTCKNVACQRDIFFLEKENFPIYRRKVRQKVLLIYGKFPNRQKGQFGLTNQRIPC